MFPSTVPTVTLTCDLGAASDILERAITCDRADMPAVIRRKHLVIDHLAAGVRAKLDEPGRPRALAHDFGIEID
jgi:hypothetical protein